MKLDVDESLEPNLTRESETKMRAPSAEEQEEAPTAKKAKHEEQIRVRARDGERVYVSLEMIEK